MALLLLVPALTLLALSGPATPQSGGPTVSIDTPTEGSTVSGTVTAQGTASDANGSIDHVEIRVDDGGWQVATGASSWSYDWDTTTYSDGEHTLEARAYNQTGASASDIVTVTVDNNRSNQAPTVSISQPQEGETVNDTVSVTGSASDPDGSVQGVEVRIDDGPWTSASGTTSWSYDWDTTAHQDGQHTLEARSYDGASHSPLASRTVTVNNTQANQAPTVSIASPSQGATVEGTTTVSGSAGDPDSSVQGVQVRIDGGAWQPATGTTSWSYSWDTTAHQDGQHTLEARSYDGASHSPLASRTVTVDNPEPNQPPTVSISSPSNGATVGNTVSVTGSASDPDGSVQGVEVRIDDGPWTSASGTTSWSYDWDTTAHTNGQHTLSARSFDGANTSAVASISVTVDNVDPNQAPTVSISSPSNGATVGDTVTVSGSASDPDGTVHSVQVRVDGGSWNVASGTGSWSFQWDTRGVGNGQHTLEVRASDGTTYSPHASRTVDVQNQATNQAPTVQITKPSDGATLQGQQTVLGTATDPDGGVAGVLYRIDEGSWRYATGTSQWSFAWDTTAEANGSHTLHVQASDGYTLSSVVSRTVTVANEDGTEQAGNQTNDTASNDTTSTATGDNRPPALEISSPGEGAEVEGEVVIEGTAFDPDPGGNVTAVEVRIDQGTWQNATGSGTWRFTWDAGNASLGSHVLTARALDGQAASQVAVRHVVVVASSGEPLEAQSVDQRSDAGGNQPPTVELLEPAQGETVDGAFTVRGVAEDPDDDRVTVEVRVDGQAWTSRRVTTGEPFEMTFNASTLGTGEHTIDVRVSDGKATTEPQSLTVETPAQGVPNLSVIVVVLTLGGAGLVLWTRR